MKKLFILSIILLSAYSVNAQTFKFGLKGGANFSSLEGDNIESSKYTSFHFGGLVEISLLENLSVQPELLYSSQGAKFDEAAVEDINYNYITVNLLGKCIHT